MKTGLRTDNDTAAIATLSATVERQRRRIFRLELEVARLRAELLHAADAQRSRRVVEVALKQMLEG